MHAAAAEAGSLSGYERYAVNRLIRHNHLPARGVSCIGYICTTKS